MSVPLDQSVSLIGMIFLGLLQAVSIFFSRRNHRKIEVVTEKQDRIYELVNHPMGIALDSLATALETVARLNPNSETAVQAAQSARSRSNEHNVKQSIADAHELHQAREEKENINVCLVVEDNRVMRELMKGLTSGIGWKSDLADNAEVALGLARNTQYPVAFVDMRLPRMMGHELITQLRAFNPKMHIVVILTEISDLSKMPEGLYFGCIVKPPFIDSIRDALQFRGKL
jgi:CheY-like chemotaxis protein